MRWLSFRIFNKSAEDLGMRFAIRESQAVESIPFSGVIPTPASPEAVLGTLNYRGKPIRVFDLGSALGLGPGQLPQRVRLLIARRSRISPPIAKLCPSCNCTVVPGSTIDGCAEALTVEPKSGETFTTMLPLHVQPNAAVTSAV